MSDVVIGYLDASDMRVVEEIAEDLYFSGDRAQRSFQWVASVESNLRIDGPLAPKSGPLIETSRTGATADDAIRNLTYALRAERIILA